MRPLCPSPANINVVNDLLLAKAERIGFFEDDHAVQPIIFGNVARGNAMLPFYSAKDILWGAPERVTQEVILGSINDLSLRIPVVPFFNRSSGAQLIE